MVKQSSLFSSYALPPLNILMCLSSCPLPPVPGLKHSGLNREPVLTPRQNAGQARRVCHARGRNKWTALLLLLS